MDQESLAQIQQIIGAATEAIRVEITDVKRHTDVATEALQEEIVEAKRHTGVLTEGLSPDNSRLVTQKSHRGPELCYRSGVETLLHPGWRTSDGDRLYPASDLRIL